MLGLLIAAKLLVGIVGTIGAWDELTWGPLTDDDGKPLPWILRVFGAVVALAMIAVGIEGVCEVSALLPRGPWY